MSKPVTVILQNTNERVQFGGVFSTDPRERMFEVAAACLRQAGEHKLAAEIEYGCLHLNPGEPFFALRGQDVSAPTVVEHWALINNPHSPPHKIEAARKVADEMRLYTGAKKDPD